MTQNENKQFWQQRALNKGFNTKNVTDNDVYRRELEITSIIPYIPVNGVGIDVGCGSAYGTDEFSEHCSSIVCSDFSENMIELAKQNHSSNSKLSFRVEDIVNHVEEENVYDFAISQRCLINILDVKNQYKAIDNIHKKLKPGGLYIMLEGSKNGRQELNNARITAGLPAMPDVPFNLDFDEDDLREHCHSKFKFVRTEYLGFYDYISRVIYPLSISPDQPKYESSVNKYLYEMMSSSEAYEYLFWECSRTFLFVMEKR
jgi:SAM-dependent methyltransferase